MTIIIIIIIILNNASQIMINIINVLRNLKHYLTSNKACYNNFSSNLYINLKSFVFNYVKKKRTKAKCKIMLVHQFRCLKFAKAFCCYIYNYIYIFI